MMLVGMVWALAAPLLLVLAWWLLQRALRAWWPEVAAGWRAVAAAALVVLPVLALYLPARLAFHDACAELGKPLVLQRLPVDGFLLDDSTANSFGTRYLHDEGFAWYEARSIYRRDGFTRYDKAADGSIRTQEVDRSTARVKVSSRHEQRQGGIHVNHLRIVDQHTGVELARAGQVHFDGGPAKWVLGMYGGGACPNPAWPGGSADFQLYYHLAKATLR